MGKRGNKERWRLWQGWERLFSEPPQVLLYWPIFHEKLEMGNFVCGNPPIFSSCSLCGTQQPLIGAESGHGPPFGGF